MLVNINISLLCIVSSGNEDKSSFPGNFDEECVARAGCMLDWSREKDPVKKQEKIQLCVQNVKDLLNHRRLVGETLWHWLGGFHQGKKTATKIKKKLWCSYAGYTPPLCCCCFGSATVVCRHAVADHQLTLLCLWPGAVHFMWLPDFRWQYSHLMMWTQPMRLTKPSSMHCSKVCMQTPACSAQTKTAHLPQRMTAYDFYFQHVGKCFCSAVWPN